MTDRVIKMVKALNDAIEACDRALCQGLRDGTLAIPDAKRLAANTEKVREFRDELLGVPE